MPNSTAQISRSDEVPRVSEVPPVGTKAAALRAAFDAVGFDVPTALVWLAERGVTMDRSYGYTVLRDLSLRSVGEVTR